MAARIDAHAEYDKGMDRDTESGDRSDPEPALCATCAAEGGTTELVICGGEPGYSSRITATVQHPILRRRMLATVQLDYEMNSLGVAPAQSWF